MQGRRRNPIPSQPLGDTSKVFAARPHSVETAAIGDGGEVAKRVFVCVCLRAAVVCCLVAIAFGLLAFHNVSVFDDDDHKVGHRVFVRCACVAF